MSPTSVAREGSEDRAGPAVIRTKENLLPLLEALAGEDETSVLGLFNLNVDPMAPAFRASLAKADVDRPRVTADNATEEPIDFRSLRSMESRNAID